MKKIIISLILIITSCFITNYNVNAATFTQDAYLSNEYVVKKKDGKTHYLQLRYIHDDQKRVVYCLEPFTSFEKNKEYTEYENLYEYKNLTSDQIRKIELLIYYGYGYTSRKSSKWYAITQLLVWQVVDPTSPMYFTDTLNGKRIDKYTTEIAAIWEDVNNHDLEPDFVQEYTVNYGDGLIINELNDTYEIVKSDFENSTTNAYIINSIKEEGSIIFKKKKGNIYSNNFVIYDSYDSQDLILPGEIENIEMKIDIKVTKGDISLNLEKIDDAYSIDSDAANTCYLIYNDIAEYEKVCTEKTLNYKTTSLPYGEYKIKQVSKGIGYHFDNKIYSVTISKENEHPSLTIYNKLIKNTIFINKLYCKDDICKEEKDAEFAVYDSKDNLVKTIKTNEKGQTNITLGYGKYKIIQTLGTEGYKLANNFNIKIVDDTTKLEQEIHNEYIETKDEFVEAEKLPSSEIEEIIPEPIPEEKEEEKVEVLPPKTGIQAPFSNTILISIILIVKKAFN